MRREKPWPGRSRNHCRHSGTATGGSDNMFQQILYSSDPELEEAREILQKVERRELYKYVGESLPSDSKRFKLADYSELETQLANAIPKSNKTDIKLEKDDFIVDVIHLDYGMKDQDPINNVWFYTKFTLDKAKKITQEQVSRFLPKQFEELLIRVYCKRTDENSLKAAKEYFMQWCTNQGFVIRQGEDDDGAPANDSAQQQQVG